nr:retrovirus-related Pol polyprotein from transposon TNT 1-94 [Tanacetum cinerariifolium]
MYDELTAMASKQSSSGPALNDMTPGTISSGLVHTNSSSTSYVPPSRNDWDLLFQPIFDELLNPPPSGANQAPEAIAPIVEVIPPVNADLTGSPSSTMVEHDAPSTSNSTTPTETQSLVIPPDVGDDNLDMEVAHLGSDPLVGIPILEINSKKSTTLASPQAIVQTDHPLPHNNSKWTKDHPLNNIIGQLDRPVSTSLQNYINDYSRFTWVKFLRSKDENPDFIIKFLKMIQVRLKVSIRRIRTDNGTEFVNQTLREYYEEVCISHETSVARSPQQNGVIERRNRTLIKAAHTMLIYAQAPLFLWAEAVATACYTQNRSIIRLFHGKTPYELLHNKLPDLSFLYVFGALWYPTNDSENLGKLQPKADIGIFIGYAPTKKAFRIYNQRTRRIVETIHVDFDELTAMAFEHSSSGPALHEMTPATIKVEDDNLDIEVAHMGNDPLLGVPITEDTSAQSSST